MLSKLHPDWKQWLVILETLLLVVFFIYTPVEGEGETTTKEPEFPKERQQLTITASVKADKYVPPPPQPKPQPKSVYVPVGKETVVKLIQSRFGTDPRILALVNCESGFNTDIVSPVDNNGYRNVGLFQINLVHGQTVDYWKNVNNNIQKAWALSAGGTNWNPWPSCKYTAGLLS